MRPPRCSLEQLHFLGHKQRAELGREALNEVLVRIYSGPMRPTVSIIVELPQMQNLVDRAGISLEVSHQLLLMAALLERGKAYLLVEPYGLRHGRRGAYRFSVHREPSDVSSL